MGTQQILESINADALKTDIPRFDIGDTLNVHVRIVEGEKERTQVFSGVLIGLVAIQRYIRRDEAGVQELIGVKSLDEQIQDETV